MSKHAMNFRLSEQAMNILNLLENKLHTTKTAVIEAALEDFAKYRLTGNKLLAYVGMLKDDEAKTMLKNIKTNRKNKP